MGNAKQGELDFRGTTERLGVDLKLLDNDIANAGSVVERANDELAALLKKRSEVLKKWPINCSCGKTSAISEWDHITVDSGYWWDDGNYDRSRIWKTNEVYHLIKSPCCGAEHKIKDQPDEWKKEYGDMVSDRSLFKNSTERTEDITPKG